MCQKAYLGRSYVPLGFNIFLCFCFRAVKGRARLNQERFDRQFPKLKCHTPVGDPLHKMAEANALMWQRHAKNKEALAKAMEEMELSVDKLLNSETVYFDISD